MGLLFIKTRVAYQWVHHWRSWHPLHQHPITAHCPSVRGGTSWSLTHTWWSGDGPNLAQWVLECYGPIMSKSHHSTILLPTLWFLHSFRHLFRNVPWTLGRLIRCPVCDRAEFPLLFHWSTCLFFVLVPYCSYYYGYNVKLGTVVPSVPFFSVYYRFGYLEFLCFQVHFKAFFSHLWRLSWEFSWLLCWIHNPLLII